MSMDVNHDNKVDKKFFGGKMIFAFINFLIGNTLY